MQTQKANWQQYATMLFAAFLIVGLFAGWGNPDITTEKVVIEQTSCDLGDINEKVDELQNTLDEEDLWKAQAIELATDEWSKSDYKYLYRFLEDIDDKDDIRKVIIKDSEVTDFNVDDQDAVVFQELKVYYENLEGDDVKVYVNVETIIEEGDVEDFEFFFR